MARNAKFGLDVGVYGRLATPDTILSLARHAEALEFESIWLADHVAFPVAFKSPYPYSASGDFPTELSEPLMEPIATMGVLVGATKRLRIGTAVLVMPHRNPVLLARMLATLDNFSNGRITLGAGVGWLAEEFKVLGTADFAKRGKVTDEYLEIFKAICAGGRVGYQGETYSFDPVFSAPGSVQRPHPPILVGGLSNPALRRVARLGDGWLAVTVGTAALPGHLANLRRFCGEAGRRFEDLSLVYKMFLNLGEPKRSKFDDREPGSGSAPQVVDDLKAIFDQGFKTVIVRYRGNSAEEQMTQIARFVDDIIPRV